MLPLVVVLLSSAAVGQMEPYYAPHPNAWPSAPACGPSPFDWAGDHGGDEGNNVWPRNPNSWPRSRAWYSAAPEYHQEPPGESILAPPPPAVRGPREAPRPASPRQAPAPGNQPYADPAAHVPAHYPQTYPAVREQRYSPYPVTAPGSPEWSRDFRRLPPTTRRFDARYASAPSGPPSGGPLLSPAGGPGGDRPPSYFQTQAPTTAKAAEGAVGDGSGNVGAPDSQWTGLQMWELDAADWATLRDYTIVRPGFCTMAVGPRYSWSEDRRVICLPTEHWVPSGLLHDELATERLRQRRLDVPLSAALGVMPGMECFGYMPFVFAQYERSDPEHLYDDAVSGFGDFVFGVRYEFFNDRPREQFPNWVAELNVTVPVARNESRPDYIDLGTGFWEIDTKLWTHQTFRSPEMGAVTLFGMLGYRARCERMREFVKVDPGDVIEWEGGAAMPLNTAFTARALLRGDFTLRTELDGVKVPDSRTEACYLAFEVVRKMPGARYWKYFCRLGVNSDAPSYMFGVEYRWDMDMGWCDPGDAKSGAPVPGSKGATVETMARAR